MVTHYHVSLDDADRAADVVRKIVDGSKPL